MRTHLLTIGDEILIGQVTDTNTVWMAQIMMENGFHIASKSACSDTAESILNALRQATENAEIILMTGGLGPTKDDITKKVLAERFGGKLVFHEETYARIARYFEKVGRPVPPTMRDLQSMLPDNCDILPNRVGQAPGMWWERDGKIFVSMPGVPFEMQDIMENQVIPRLKSKFPGRPIAHRTILTAGEGESTVARRLENFEENLPENIGLAYLPALMQVRLRLTGTHDDPVFLEKQLDAEAAKIHALLPDIIYGVEKQTLESVIGDLLVARNLTVGTAESCTGGYVAHLLTSVPGASRYFPGSVVAYSYVMKEKLLGVPHGALLKTGAVSEQTVREMVAGALELLNVDIAVSISGIAGPDGGTDDKPVGTVWMAVGNREKTEAQKMIYGRDRQKNIHMSAVGALGMLRKFILENY